MITEMKSPPPQSPLTADGKELDQASLAHIRSVMHDTPPRRVRPRHKPSVSKSGHPFASILAEEPAAPELPIHEIRPKSERLPIIAAPEKPKPPRKRSVVAVAFAETKARIGQVLRTPKYVAVAAIAILVFFRPWLVFWTLVFSVFAMICVFLVLGYDGFWQRAMQLGRWYAKRNPRRAVKLNRKLDAFALKWDMVLDHFPDGTVDGLYLPDFGELAVSEQRHDQALDRRFAGLREGEA